MQQKTIAIGPASSILVRAVPGDLRVAGWKRPEMMVKTDGDVLEINADGDPLTISCDEDLILYIPQDTVLRVESVAGDASLQALYGAVTIGTVAGDFSLRDTGGVTVESVAGNASLRGVGGVIVNTVAGDFALRGGGGDCVVQSAGGDASLRDIAGAVTLGSVGSDLYVRNVSGSVTAETGSDAVLYLEPQPGAEYRVSAGDDLLLRLPLEADTELHLTAGKPGSIHMDFPGVTLGGDGSACDCTLGAGAARMFMTAGDDLMVTSQAGRWDSAADFGVEMNDIGDLPHFSGFPPISNLPPDFSDRISRRVQAAMDRAHSHVDSTTRRAETRASAAMRRAEAKARAAEVRAHRWKVESASGGPHARVNIGRWKWDLPPNESAGRGEPVGDEERLSILKMLQEKKISLEEAEKLLAALEGK